MAAVLCIMLITAATAILVMIETKSNQFSTGKNTSSIEEKFDMYYGLYAGEDYEKEVRVKNTGDVPCYVRVFAEFEDPDVRQKIEVDYNSVDWSEKQDDGYYYYKKPIASGESTEPLFTTLHVLEDSDRLHMICYSETIQSDGAESAINAFSSLD